MIQVFRGIQFMLCAFYIIFFPPTHTQTVFFLHHLYDEHDEDGMKKFLAMKINKLSCQLTSTFVLLLLVHCPSFSYFLNLNCHLSTDSYQRFVSEVLYQIIVFNISFIQTSF